MAINEGARTAKFIVISLTPDVCKSPVVPVPYPIVGKFEDSISFSPTVRFRKKNVFIMKTRVSTVIGDEAGVGGGVISGVNKGMCRPINHSPTVRATKSNVILHQETLMWMNCAGPEGPGNTIGTVKYLEPMFAASVSPSGAIPPADPAPLAETAAEGGFLSDLMAQAGGVEGLVGYAQQAYSLATTDWSNPAAVLGAIGGVAGAAGLGQMAQVAGFASQAAALAQTDFSNPGAVMGAAMNLAGPALGKAALGAL